MCASKICQTCTWWKPVDKLSQGYYPDMGNCKSPKFVYAPTAETDNLPDSLTYEDYESYGAVVRTGRNFGCIHHHQA